LFIVPLRAAHTGQNLTINGFRLYPTHATTSSTNKTIGTRD
jgi:hypothetical protein